MNNDSLPLELHHASTDASDEATQLFARLMAGARRPDAAPATRDGARARLLEQAAGTVMQQSCTLPGAVLTLLR